MITKTFNFPILNLDKKSALDSVTGEEMMASKAFAAMLNIGSTTEPDKHCDFAQELWDSGNLNVTPKEIEELKSFLNQAKAPNFIKAQIKKELMGTRKELEIVDTNE